MKSWQSRMVLLGALAVAGFAMAKDYRVPFYTLGLPPSQSDATNAINYDNATWLTTGDQPFGPTGVPLSDFKDLCFIGCMGGAAVSTNGERYMRASRNVCVHTDGNGVVDKIVFSVPNCFVKDYTKGVIVQLTKDSNNRVVAKALGARYISGNNATYQFVTMDADGTVKMNGNTMGVANSITASGYGVAGLSATKTVPTAAPGLMFPNCTVEEIRNHHFSGMATGAWMAGNAGNLMQGYNQKVFETGGVATKIRVEMQIDDRGTIKCAIIELTDGEGGVYAKNVAARYVSGSLGYAFVNASGGYVGNNASPADGFADGYGVMALAATEQPATPLGAGFLSTMDRLIWRGAKLDNVLDVGGWHLGPWVPQRDNASQTFYLRSGSGVGSTLEFESQSTMENMIRATTVVLTEKADGVYGRLTKFRYGPGAVGSAGYTTGGTGVDLSLTPGSGCYGLLGLCGRIVEPTEVALAAPTHDFTEAFATTRAHFTGTEATTITASVMPDIRYWDFTDVTGAVTMGVVLTNTSIIAGREMVFTDEFLPQQSAISGNADSAITFPGALPPVGCGLHTRGKVTFQGDGTLNAFVDGIQFAKEAVYEGDLTITGGGQGDNKDNLNRSGFMWTGSGRLVLKGKVNVTEGRNLSFVSEMSGPIVIAEGAEVTFGNRITVAAQNLSPSYGHLSLEGGTLSGGWIYHLSPGTTQIDIKAGTMTTALAPWVAYNSSKQVNIGQTGGLFAPTSLQPLTENNKYDGTKSTYTLAGGTFVPPAGWTANFPWLNLVVPATSSNATIRIRNDALLPALNTVEGPLQLASDAEASTLTLATLEGTGPIVVTEGTVRLVVPEGKLGAHPLSVAAGATFVKADATALALPQLDAETVAGSLEFPAGAISMLVESEIGGKLTLGADATLELKVDGRTLVNGQAVLTAADGIVLEEGATVSVSIGELRLSQDGKQLLYTADATMPYRAVWKGEGERANCSDPANWTCWNVFGEELSDTTVPNAKTFICVSGTTALNVPAAFAGAFYGYLFTGDIVLSADCDWRGVVATTNRIDLNGHALTVSTLAATGEITDTSLDASKPGVLTVEVPEGQTVTTFNKLLSGNLRLVKAGAGQWTDQSVGENGISHHTYVGGTQIEAGTFYAYAFSYPTNASTIVVASNAIFTVDHGEFTGLPTAPTYELAGGMFNSANDWSVNWAGVTKMRLTADSVMGGAATFGLIGPGYSETTLDLGGHTLTVPLVSPKTFMFFNTKMTPGLVKVTNGGWLLFDKTEVRAGETDFDLNCALDVRVPVTVHDLTIRFPTYENAVNDGTIKIRGRYTPVSDYIHHFELQDGATIDLSQRTTVCPTVNPHKDRAACKLTYAAGATVYVGFGTRRVPNGDKVLNWTAIPEGITFKTARGGMAYRLVLKDDGIYVEHSGLTLFLR